jgi:hypothetical protein
MSTKYLLMIAGCLMMVPCLGCGPGGPELGAVEGTVIMDNEPLPNASVVFIPENGRPAGARTDEEGHYELNFTEGRQGAMLGPAKVLITTVRDPGTDEEGNPIPGSPETVPKRYNTQTELTFTVKEGHNTADFKLSSEGELAAPDALIQESTEETE